MCFVLHCILEPTAFCSLGKLPGSPGFKNRPWVSISEVKNEALPLSSTCPWPMCLVHSEELGFCLTSFFPR